MLLTRLVYSMATDMQFVGFAPVFSLFFLKNYYNSTKLILQYYHDL
jgi:hypothetical protein